MEKVVKDDKKIISKGKYTLYFALTYILFKCVFNVGANLFLDNVKMEGAFYGAVISCLTIISTFIAMFLNYYVHRNHRVNKHQFPAVRNTNLTIVYAFTAAFNIMWVIGAFKYNTIFTISALIVHVVLIYLLNTVLFDKYVGE